MKRFSIVIGSYNHAKTIGKLVESLMGQTFQDFEVILCDDGSTDGTVDEFRRLCPEGKVVSQKHRGMRLARNLNNGLRAADGLYSLLVMGDSFLETDYLETLEKWVGPERLICGVRFQVDDGRGVDADWRLKKSAIPPENALLSGRVWAMTTGNGLCLPTRAFHHHGYLDQGFEGYGGEDTEIVMRLYYKGFTVWSIVDLKLYHNWHPSQDVNPKAIERLKRLEKRYAA